MSHAPSAVVPSYKVPALEDDKVGLIAEALTGNFQIRQNKDVARANYVSTLPAVIAVRPEPEARPSKCWFNVRDAVDKQGGKAIFGWAIWIRPDSHYQAIHHAVWERPEGFVVDVTPTDTGAGSIVFMADSRVPFDYVSYRAPPSYVMHKDSTKGSVQEFWLAPDGQTFNRYVLLRMEDNEETARYHSQNRKP